MPGLKGISRLPRHDQRSRRNSQQLARQFPIAVPLAFNAAGYLTVGLGDGLAESSGVLVVDLATTPGLEFSTAKLRVKIQNPIKRDASGIGLNIGSGLTLSGADLIVNNAVYVPYTGATADLNLGTKDLLCTDLTVSTATALTGTFGVCGQTPAAQQAHIVDADGNLADITTKFNTLLSHLETYGLLAAS